MRIVALVGLGMLAAARPAVAQARGTLQTSATIVDTRVSTASLAAVNHLVRNTTARRVADNVAVIRIERHDDSTRRLVVTIDYSRN